MEMDNSLDCETEAEPGIFCTEDLYLGAYLRTRGMALLCAGCRASGHAIWEFEEHQDRPRFEIEWIEDKVAVPPRQFLADRDVLLAHADIARRAKGQNGKRKNNR